MSEFRISPENVNITLISKQEYDCIACKKLNRDPDASIQFKNYFVKLYQIDDNVSPSKYELNGNDLKYSLAHGYEEIIIDKYKHGDNFEDYSVEDINKLLLILKDRVSSLSRYDFGDNLLISRNLSGHGFFDLVITPVPRIKYTKLNINNLGDREILRTENFVVYSPFAPIKTFEINISPIKHISFKDIDEVISFDLSGLLFNLLHKIKTIKEFVIIENFNKHFVLRLFNEYIDPFSFLNINRVYEYPERFAESIRKLYEK